MIKGQAGNVVVIGLSRMNVERLMGGMPIRFAGEGVGIPGKVFVIFAGETEPEMVAELKKFGLIDADTKVDDRFTGKGGH